MSLKTATHESGTSRVLLNQILISRNLRSLLRLCYSNLWCFSWHLMSHLQMPSTHRNFSFCLG